MNEAKIIGNNALALDTTEFTGVVEPEKESKLDREVSLIEKRASTVVVASDADFAFAAELTKQVKQMQAQVTEYWEPMRKSAYDAYTSVNRHKKQMLDPLASAEKILKKKMGDYTVAQERQHREREAAMRREAAAEMNRKLDEAAQAEAVGDVDGYEAAMVGAEVMEDVSLSGGVQMAVPKAKGVSQTKTWKIKSIDGTKVPVSFAGMELRPVNEKLVLQLIKASKGKIAIPGVEYEEDFIISVKS